MSGEAVEKLRVAEKGRIKVLERRLRGEGKEKF